MNEKIIFLGDFLYNYKGYKEDIKKIGEWMKKNNYKVILNLEAPLKSSKALSKWINLYQDENIISVLKTLNVIAVNLGNNHILDWSEEGLTNLIMELKKNNIQYFGAGLNLKEANEPVIIDFGKKKIGLLAYGWKEEMCEYASNSKAGVSPLKESLIIDSVSFLKKKVDYVILSFHWGYEYELYPLPIHRKLVHKLIDKGLADCIIGHHPHVIQAKEIYKGKSIYYSLGNFYFGDRRDYFEELKNEIAKEYSKYGLGIILDAKLNIKETFFRYSYEEKKTLLHDGYEMLDISEITLLDYNNFFKEKRTSKRKPSLYSYKKGEMIIGEVKLKINFVKEQLLWKTIGILKKLKLTNIIKKIIGR